MLLDRQSDGAIKARSFLRALLGKKQGNRD